MRGCLSVTQTQTVTKKDKGEAEHEFKFRLQVDVAEAFERLTSEGLNPYYAPGRKSRAGNQTEPQSKIIVNLEKPRVKLLITSCLIQVYYRSERDFWGAVRLLSNVPKSGEHRDPEDPKLFPDLFDHLDCVTTVRAEAVDMKGVLILQEHKIGILVDELNVINDLVRNLLENNDVQKFLKDYAELRGLTDEKLADQQKDLKDAARKLKSEQK